MSTKNIETLMQVTSFKSWLVLWAMGAALVAVIVWSIVGSLPERIEGKGKIQTIAGTQEITSPDFGLLQEFTPKEGDTVRPGQVVGKVKSARRSEELIAAQRQVDEVRRRFADFQSSEVAGIQDLRQQRVRKAAILKEAQDELARQTDLLRKNQTTNSAVDRARSDVAIAVAGLQGVDGQISAKQSAIASRANEVTTAEARLKAVFDASTDFAEVKSTVAGRITLIKKRPGAMLFPAEPIATVDSALAGNVLNVVAFVPARTGKRILPGQFVRLSVAGLPSNEYGYLRGEVEEIKPYPVNPDYVERILSDRPFEEGTYEVRIKLLQQDGRYVWMGGAGADDKVASNTPVDVSVQVAEQRPFTLVIPWNEEDRRSVAERSSKGSSPGSN